MRTRYFVIVEVENEKTKYLMFRNKKAVKAFLKGEVSHIDIDPTANNTITGVFLANEVIFGNIEDCTEEFDCYMGG